MVLFPEPEFPLKTMSEATGPTPLCRCLNVMLAHWAWYLEYASMVWAVAR